VWYAFDKVVKPGMVLKDEQLMAIQHIYNDKDMFVRLLGYGNIMVSPFVFVLRIHFEKTEATYRRHRLGHRTTVVHGVAVVHLSEYFSVLLSAISVYMSR